MLNGIDKGSEKTTLTLPNRNQDFETEKFAFKWWRRIWRRTACISCATLLQPASKTFIFHHTDNLSSLENVKFNKKKNAHEKFCFLLKNSMWFSKKNFGTWVSIHATSNTYFLNFVAFFTACRNFKKGSILNGMLMQY